MRSIYLAGPITGLNYTDAKHGWREAFVTALENIYIGDQCFDMPRVLSPMRGLEHLKNITDLHFHSENTFTTPKGCLARDYSDISRSDLVVCCLLGAKRVSIGTMVELGLAYALRKPVVLIMESRSPEPPPNGGALISEPNVHEHGWVHELAAYEVHTLEAAAHIVSAFCSEGL